MSAGDRNLESAGSNPTFVPSEAMVEAGARALAHAEGYEDWDALAMHAQFTYREKARAVLVAACTATVTEPCPTCGDRGWVRGQGDTVRERMPTACPDHRDSSPSWAWLVPFLNAGLLESMGMITQNVPVGTWEALRVLPPATPGEGK